METSQGFVVEQLLESGVAVYPISTTSAKAYCQRKVPTDHVDAWSLADALRVDGHGWKALAKEDPLVAELRLLCRDEVALIEEHTALINQLQSALREYYQASLEAFEDWTLPSAWAFVEAFPTPQALVSAGKRKWEKFLHTQQLARPPDLSKAGGNLCAWRRPSIRGSTTPSPTPTPTFRKLLCRSRVMWASTATSRRPSGAGIRLFAAKLKRRPHDRLPPEFNALPGRVHAKVLAELLNANRARSNRSRAGQLAPGQTQELQGGLLAAGTRFSYSH